MLSKTTLSKTARGSRIAFLAAIVCVPSAAASAGDLEIAQQVAENLRDGGMKHYSIGVGSREGVATLRGNVASDEQRRLALSIARRTDGVRRVHDELSISSTGAPSVTNGIEPSRYDVAQEGEMPAARLGPVDLTAYLALAATRRYLVPDTGSFEVELDDGSRIVARAVHPAQFQLETDLGTVTVPLKLVESIERGDGENAVRVRLSNGDRITGRFEFQGDREIRLMAVHGEMRVVPKAIISVTRRDDQNKSRY